MSLALGSRRSLNFLLKAQEIPSSQALLPDAVTYFVSFANIVFILHRYKKQGLGLGCGSVVQRPPGTSKTPGLTPTTI
jgi:hypothetical protein